MEAEHLLWRRKVVELVPKYLREEKFLFFLGVGLNRKLEEGDVCVTQVMSFN